MESPPAPPGAGSPAPVPRCGDTVRTRSGRRLRLSEELGRGGQGVVFRTACGRHAVKVRFSQDEDGRWARAVDRVRMLTFDRARLDGFVLPNERLAAPSVGYEMGLLRRATPVSSLVELPREEPEAWYVGTGGLQRRLDIAARVARRLSDLHAAGLVFGDLSAANVLVPDDVRYATVQLIDCDNVAPPGAAPEVLATPGYAAPEVWTGAMRPDARSDAHALAVLLHELVFLSHPLQGDALLKEEPEAAEERMHRGAVPWVWSEEDPSNPTSAGLPPELALRRGTLFQHLSKAFGPGLHDRTRRPSAAALATGAERAARMVLSCPGCSAGLMLERGLDECPWCGGDLGAPWVLLLGPDATWEAMREAAEAHRRAERLLRAPVRAHDRMCVVNGTLALTTRLLAPWRLVSVEDQRLGELHVTDGGVVLRSNADGTFLVAGETLRAGRECRLHPSDTFRLPHGPAEDRVAPGCLARLVRVRLGGTST